MFALEISTGFLTSSVMLLADNLDMLGGTLLYGFSLFAIIRNEGWKVHVALLK